MAKIVQYVYPMGQTDEFAKKNNLQRIEKPNRLEQLGLPCRRPGFFNPLEKLALFFLLILGN
jgi:hypothetical protein